MSIERHFGRPVVQFLRPGLAVLPIALLVLIVGISFPRLRTESVTIVAFTIVAAAFVLFTPYLMLAEFCLYQLSQLPFPRSLQIDQWIWHVGLLAAVALLLWRTWVLWPPEWSKGDRLPDDAVAAPWWGYLIGGVMISGIVGVMIYFLHFTE